MNEHDRFSVPHEIDEILELRTFANGAMVGMRRSGPMRPVRSAAMTTVPLPAKTTVPLPAKASRACQPSRVGLAHRLLDTRAERDWRSVCSSVPPARNGSAPWLRAHLYPGPAAGKPCC